MALVGGVGGAGVMTMAMHNNAFTAPLTADVSTWLGHLHTFLTAVAGHFGSAVTYEFSQTTEFLDAPTAALVGVNTAAVIPANVAGGGFGDIAAGCGYRIRWVTSNIRNRRLVKGYTMLTPIPTSDLGTDGNISSVAAGIVKTAAQSYLSNMAGSALVPCVYSRPHPVGAGNGVLSDIDSAAVGVTFASLRSRRV